MFLSVHSAGRHASPARNDPLCQEAVEELLWLCEWPWWPRARPCTHGVFDPQDARGLSFSEGVIIITGAEIAGHLGTAASVYRQEQTSPFSKSEFKRAQGQHVPGHFFVQNAHVDDDIRISALDVYYEMDGRKSRYIKKNVLVWYRGEDARDLKRSVSTDLVENMTSLSALEAKISKREQSWKSEKVMRTS